MRRFVGTLGCGGVAGGVPRQVPPPNALSASWRAWGNVMSPATTRSAPAGRSRWPANFTTSSRVIALKDAALVARP